MCHPKYRYHDRSADVLCPFFLAHGRQTLKCEGCDEGSVTTTAYPRGADLRWKMQEFCCKSYRQCFQYRMVNYAKYDGEGL